VTGGVVVVEVLGMVAQGEEERGNILFR